jgi:hypothetical protein
MNPGSKVALKKKIKINLTVMYIARNTKKQSGKYQRK